MAIEYVSGRANFSNWHLNAIDTVHEIFSVEVFCKQENGDLKECSDQLCGAVQLAVLDGCTEAVDLVCKGDDRGRDTYFEATLSPLVLDSKKRDLAIFLSVNIEEDGSTNPKLKIDLEKLVDDLFSDIVNDIEWEEGVMNPRIPKRLTAMADSFSAISDKIRAKADSLRAAGGEA